MLRHAAQPIIVDPLAVDGSHIISGRHVAHDGIDGNLVACVTADSLKPAAKGIEAQSCPV
jgi:hypothetical protein